mgnify:CR=1 FL=1
MAWDVAFDLRGKRREMRLSVAQFDRPEKVVILGDAESLALTVEMTVIALTPAKSRVIFELEARPQTIRARLMLQTAKLGKAQLDRRYQRRIEDFVHQMRNFAR